MLKNEKKKVNSSPLPSTVHRLHQTLFNQSSQPIGSDNTSTLYKSPPPPPSPTPIIPPILQSINQKQQRQQSALNHQLQHHHQQQQLENNNEFNQQANYFLNQQQQQFDQLNYDQTTLNAISNNNSMQGQISSQLQQQQQTQNALANQSLPYITPKYVRSNLTNKKLPVIDCSKISSMNYPLHHTTSSSSNQFGASNAQQQYQTIQQQQQQQFQPVKTSINHSFIKSPPSSGSSLETNSPRSSSGQQGKYNDLLVV